jgi:hypothetical protein
MYLAFKDLADLFTDSKGVKNADHMYHTVSDKANVLQPKGLFTPVNENSGDLLEAIANGAIAAVWNKKIMLPRYTPNHFPVFFTDDPIDAVGKVLYYYTEKIDGDRTEQMNMTNFLLFNKKLLIDNIDTYDIAVMLEKLSTTNVNSVNERRE